MASSNDGKIGKGRYKKGDTVIAKFIRGDEKKWALKKSEVQAVQYDPKKKQWQYYIHYLDMHIKYDEWIDEHLLAPLDDPDAQQRLLPSSAAALGAEAGTQTSKPGPAPSRPTDALYSNGTKLMALWTAGGTSKKLYKVVVLDVRREKKGALRTFLPSFSSARYIQPPTPNSYTYRDRVPSALGGLAQQVRFLGAGGAHGASGRRGRQAETAGQAAAGS